ncbi:MAG: larA 2 [Peptococcaceae bacterium]|jgi:nickel-dependent lactate racemase|nr:larA 2 [Peptococcaceae bacterium]
MDALREFKLRYGDVELSVKIPADQVLHVIEGKEFPPISDIPGAVLRALEKPIDSPPLREIVKPGDRVVITVSDITRAWIKNHLFLPTTLNVLNEAGVPDSNIEIIIAVGAHRKNTEEEFKVLVGEEVFRRVKRISNHDCHDKANLKYMGKTSSGTPVYINKTVAEADKVILTGGIVYHFMAGFGGGRKSVLPGISGLETIQASHLLCMAEKEGDGLKQAASSSITYGNPAHEDMMEIAAFLKPDFLLNVVLTPAGEYAGIFAGNWVSAFYKGCELVEKIYGIPIEQEADIVIASAGGFPKDINLYQSSKTMDNAFYAVRKGGVVIILSECRDIYEPLEFTDWFRYDTPFEMEKALRANFRIPGYVAFREVECSKKATYIFVTRAENAELIKKAQMIPVTTVEEALEFAFEKVGKDAKITIMPQGANTFPIKK